MLDIHGMNDGNGYPVPDPARRNANSCGNRRTFLQVGTLGAAGMASLSLADLLRMQATAQDPTKPARKKSVILVWLAGGPSHIDMYDLKPASKSVSIFPTKLA
jgi:hypothetical protein